MPQLAPPSPPPRSDHGGPAARQGIRRDVVRARADGGAFGLPSHPVSVGSGDFRSCTSTLVRRPLASLGPDPPGRRLPHSRRAHDCAALLGTALVRLGDSPRRPNRSPPRGGLSGQPRVRPRPTASASVAWATPSASGPSPASSPAVARHATSCRSGGSINHLLLHRLEAALVTGEESLEPTSPLAIICHLIFASVLPRQYVAVTEPLVLSDLRRHCPSYQVHDILVILY